MRAFGGVALRDVGAVRQRDRNLFRAHVVLSLRPRLNQGTASCRETCSVEGYTRTVPKAGAAPGGVRKGVRGCSRRWARRARPPHACQAPARLPVGDDAPGCAVRERASPPPAKARARAANDAGRADQTRVRGTAAGRPGGWRARCRAGRGLGDAAGAGGGGSNGEPLRTPRSSGSSVGGSSSGVGGGRSRGRASPLFKSAQRALTLRTPPGAHRCGGAAGGTLASLSSRRRRRRRHSLRPAMDC